MGHSSDGKIQERLPTLEQSLPYTNFPSIIPFLPELLPVPSADTPLGHSLFANQAERDQATLQASRFVPKNDVAEAHLAFRELRDMVQANARDIYTFKPRLPTLSFESPGERCMNGDTWHVKAPRLSSLAQALLDTTNIELTETSIQQPLGKSFLLSDAGDGMTDTENKFEPVLVGSENGLNNGADSRSMEESHLSKDPPLSKVKCENSAVSDHERAVYDNAHVVPIPQSGQKAIVASEPSPVRPTDALENFQIKPDSMSSSAKGQEQLQIKEEEPTWLRARSALDELLQDVLEVEHDDQSSTHFWKIDLGNHTFMVLKASVLARFEAHMRVLIEHDRLKEVAEGDLSRLQSFIQAPLLAVDSLDFLDPASSADLEKRDSWFRQCNLMSLAERGAALLLQIMAAKDIGNGLKAEDVLQLLVMSIKKITQNFILPITTGRYLPELFDLSGPKEPEKYEEDAALDIGKSVSNMVKQQFRVMSLLNELCQHETLSETIITLIEYLAINILFTEFNEACESNPFDARKWEALQQVTMTNIVIIYSRHPSQRSFLLDEILASLQKLPSSRYKAPRFRMKDEISVGMTTALLIQLVQLSGGGLALSGESDTSKEALNSAIKRSPIPTGDMTVDEPCEKSSDEVDSHNANSENQDPMLNCAKPYTRARVSMAATVKSAQHIVFFIIHRAQESSKTGDQPHRQVMDTFLAELVPLLGLPEWPGAELLLRMFYARSLQLLESSKTTAPAKNMALEVLGIIGSSISDLVADVRSKLDSFEKEASTIDAHLIPLFNSFTDNKLHRADLSTTYGPFKILVDYLNALPQEDYQYPGSQTYFLVQWIYALEDPSLAGTKLGIYVSSTGELSYGDHDEMRNSSNTDPPTQSQSRIAYALIMLSSGVGRCFDSILRMLIANVASEQTTVRSRALRSVTHMLDRDPSIVTRCKDLHKIISSCASDPSPLVRDAALSLIGKCCSSKSSLDKGYLAIVEHLSCDGAVYIRKRSIKLLRDMYEDWQDIDGRISMSKAILARVNDADKAVMDLARSFLEDLWLAPYWTRADIGPSRISCQISLHEHVALIAEATRGDSSVRHAFVAFLRWAHSTGSKFAAPNLDLCRTLVVTALEIVIDSSMLKREFSQRDMLESLTCFAQAKPDIFSADQLRLLLPYISNMSTLADLDLLRPVVVIYRYSMPVMPENESALLERIEAQLVQSISSLSKNELGEASECLWIIRQRLPNSESIPRLLVAVLNHLQKLRNGKYDDNSTKSDQMIRKLRKYLLITGYVGKHCDLESERDSALMQSMLPDYRGASFSAYIIDSLLPFSQSQQSLSVRMLAINAVGLICQSHPEHFTSPEISKVFGGILASKDSGLQNVVLSDMRDFLRASERPEDSSLTFVQTQRLARGNGLSGSMTANQRDGASALIAQHFLQMILSIALSRQDHGALLATEVIASINRQGLAHPKESGPALVALCTSADEKIAGLAVQEHAFLHQQHESMLEREYMRALQEAYQYGKVVLKDLRGCRATPPKAKLHDVWETIKSSKGKYQKKFLGNVCSKANFDPASLPNGERLEDMLQFSRFVIENVALLSFPRLDELQHVVTCVERIVAETGASIAHSISTEVFCLTIEHDSNGEDDLAVEEDDFERTNAVNGQGLTSSSGSDRSRPVSGDRLRQLSVAAAILSCFWEARTYLRKVYNFPANRTANDNRGRRLGAKDLAKTTTRAAGVPSTQFVAAIEERISGLSTEAGMLQICEQFVDLMATDNEMTMQSEDSAGGSPDAGECGGDNVIQSEQPNAAASRTSPTKQRLGEARDESGQKVKRKCSRSESVADPSCTHIPLLKRNRPSMSNRRASCKSKRTEDDA